MTIPVTAGTLAAPGVRLYYELRGSGPLVAMVGSPMHTAPFVPLAELLATDHTVLTTDPRGHFGSVLDDPESDSSPELRADDLARLLRHVDAGPAVVLGSSGGAITALALLQSAPELVSTAVAHEPPLAELLAESAAQRALRDDIVATFRDDEIAGIRKFIRQTELDIPEEVFQQMFVNRSPEQITEDRYFYLHELDGTSGWQPDLDALRAVREQLIIGIGEASAGLFCDRTSRALAGELDIDPVVFPGGHGGFAENPVAFAARWRDVVN